MAATWNRLESPVRKSGVYVLVEKSRVVYIGSSVNIDQRVEGHRRFTEKHLPRKNFDSVYWLAVPETLAIHYEGALIRHFNPPLNGQNPRNKGHDAEILFGLGLTDSLDEDGVRWEAV